VPPAAGATVPLKPAGAGSTTHCRVVNLCLHGIGEPQRELEPQEGRFWLSIDHFDALLDEVVRRPNVHITFDDGNISDVQIALPALLKRGLVAEFFVLAGRMGQPGSLSQSDVKILAEAGMGIGSHGMAHRSWRGLGPVAAEKELREAALLIADSAGRPVRRASCPFGAYDRSVLANLHRQGYERVFTVDGGPSDGAAWLQSRYTLQRTDIPGSIPILAADAGRSYLGSAVRGLKSAVKRWR
jgi:peptidoglycan/xylan/chitin deacetylase (PgdA/CDA1 family)